MESEIYYTDSIFACTEQELDEYYNDQHDNEDSTMSLPANDNCRNCQFSKGCVDCNKMYSAKLCINCDSCDNVTRLQNCKHCHVSENCNDCRDSQRCTDCTVCSNCFNIEKCSDCEYCSDCIKCDDCYNCEDCDNCKRCDTVVSCTKCVGCVSCYDCYCCNNCIDCVGLSHAQYVIKGVQYTRTQFKRYQLAVQFGYTSKNNSQNGLLDLPEEICVCRSCGKLYYDGMYGQC